MPSLKQRYHEIRNTPPCLGDMLSLGLNLSRHLPEPAQPIQFGGSSGGLYHNSIFDQWAEVVPFDSGRPEERCLRLLIGNLRHMRIDHYAFVGRDDGFAFIHDSIAHEPLSPIASLRLEPILGDHFTALKPSMVRFIRIIQSDPS